MDQTPCIFTTFHTDVSLTLYFLLRGRRLYVTSNNYLIHAETIVTQTSQYLEGTGAVTSHLLGTELKRLSGCLLFIG